MTQTIAASAFWLVMLGACVAATAFASRRAVESALRVSESLKISPAVVGLTVMSVGTDLPEIANSIVSTASGHGDVNVGDSMGSVLTQVTLTLGILILASRSHEISTNRNFVIAVGTSTFFASVLVWVLLQDGELSHFDGLLLIALWIGGTALLGHGELRPREVFSGTHRRARIDALAALAWLGAVGAFAIGVVESFLQAAEIFGIPEFIGSFFILAIGTSLPELFVDWRAIRQGASSMAIGDVFGSSFVDATLSIGIGPAIFASVISSDVLLGTLLAAFGVLLVTILVARSTRYEWRLGVALIAVFAVVQGLTVFAS